jgi:hypothetical protein
MAKRIFSNYNWTPGTVADGAALANATYMALKGASTTQITDILEIYVNGMAPSSSPMALCMARTAALETTPTALAAPATDGPNDPSTAALAAPVVTFTAAATGPQRSAATTDARLNCGINAFGGSYRWNAAPTQQWTMIGNALGGGESVFSNAPFGTPGAINCEIMYETH